MRWSLTLTSPILSAGSQAVGCNVEALEEVPATQTLGPDSAGRSARLWIATNGDSLEISVLAEGLKDASNRPEYPEWYFHQHIVVFLNPNHDHATRWQYSIDDAGKIERNAAFTGPGEESGDGPIRKLEDPPEAQGLYTQLDEHRYFARLTIPAGALWTDPSQPVGFGLKVGFHEEVIVPPLEFPEPVAWSKDQPLTFADLYRSEPPIAIEAVDIPEPTWGGMPSEVILHVRRGSNAPTKGLVQVATVLPTDSEERQADTAWASDASTFSIKVPVLFSHRAKWANSFQDIARLKLSIWDENEKRCWSAEYPFGFDAGIIVRERYGLNKGSALPPRPEAGHPDFVNAYRAFVLARIPHYRPRTTREGTPSDFYLEDRAGEAHLDLSAADVLDQVAAFLTQRFPDWQDALCATALWIYNPRITRHSSSWARISGQSTAGTIPRLGGCFCGDTARLGGVLAEKIGQKLNVPLKGFTMGLRGHLTSMIETPIGRVLIDGMHGMFYHTLDNQRLATLDEMREQEQIAKRMWYYPKAHGHEFFYKNYTQVIRPLEERDLEWPSGQE